MDVDGDPSLEETETSIVTWIWTEITSSYLNLGLTLAILYLVYKILFQKEEELVITVEPPKPPMKKQDMTLQQLRQYDGISENSDDRICVAVNGKIFDVSKGKRFYGPGGPYSGFAGRDASRGLATFSVEPVSDDYDDLSDLKPGELEQVQEWELQFSEKYDLVGKLLKPGEESRCFLSFFKFLSINLLLVSGHTVTSLVRRVMRVQRFSRNRKLRRKTNETRREH